MSEPPSYLFSLLVYAGDPSAPLSVAGTFLKIGLVLLLVAANGFFVAAEFALVGVRRSRIETRAAAGNRSAKRLLGLLDNLNAYLSASQLGITLASLGLGWVGEPVIARMLEGPLGSLPDAWRHGFAFAIAFSIITCASHCSGRTSTKVGWPRAGRKSCDGHVASDADVLSSVPMAHTRARLGQRAHSPIWLASRRLPNMPRFTPKPNCVSLSIYRGKAGICGLKSGG